MSLSDPPPADRLNCYRAVTNTQTGEQYREMVLTHGKRMLIDDEDLPLGIAHFWFTRDRKDKRTVIRIIFKYDA